MEKLARAMQRLMGVTFYCDLACLIDESMAEELKVRKRLHEYWMNLPLMRWHKWSNEGILSTR